MVVTTINLDITVVVVVEEVGDIMDQVVAEVETGGVEEFKELVGLETMVICTKEGEVVDIVEEDVVEGDTIGVAIID